MQINTVLGPRDTAELGFTLIHEHLLIGWAGWQWDTFAEFKRAEAMAKAIDMLNELQALGVRTFVDPCPMDIGRDPEFLAEASDKSGMNIVGSTGLYHHQLGIPSYYRGLSEEAIGELFVRDIEDGMAGTGIRAGIIKTATTAGVVTDDEQKVHRAAGRAMALTGTPVITHTDENGPMGIEQIDLFEAAGASSSGVAIGHSCGNGNLRYLMNVLDRGAWLSFDRFGFGISASDDIRIAALLGLIGIGHADRIMLSHDSVSTMLSRGFNPPPEIQATIQNWNPKHLIQNIFPRLRDAGVSDQTLDQLMVQNPRNYFEAAAAAQTKGTTAAAAGS